MLTRKQILELFNYDKENGRLYWKVRPSQRAKIGNAAGYISNGYHMVVYNGVHYRIHRLIWVIEHRREPIGDIDHINGNRGDNRIENLRECTRRENTSNKECHRKGHLVGTHYIKPEFKGEKSIRPFNRPWQSSIQINGKRIYLGRFLTQEEAHQAYLKALNYFQLKNNIPDRIKSNKIRRSEFRRQLETLEKQSHEP